jgi:ubiquinone/menaquinone biosynthesis C-methylase UbiE
MTKTPHRRHQEKYFRNELSAFADYEKSLNAWRYSYLNRIKNDLIGKSYKGKTLLDVGTGSGYIAIEMARLGVKVVASDIVKLPLRSIEKYKKAKKLKNLRTLMCSAEKIPLKAKSMDYIVINSVLEHVEDETAAINEWKRILKPNGKIFITVPLRMRYIWPFFWPINLMHDRRLGHLRRYDLNTLKNKFKMKISRVYYTGHLIKVLWFLFSRPLLGGLKKSSPLDYLFEKIDQKFEKLPYGGSNLIVIFKNT